MDDERGRPDQMNADAKSKDRKDRYPCDIGPIESGREIDPVADGAA